MGIEINVEKQRESWNLTFTSVQIALGFCNLDHVEAQKAMRGLFSESGDLADRIGADLAESLRYLKGAVQVVETGIARFEVSKDRALGRKRGANDGETHRSPAVEGAVQRRAAGYRDRRFGGLDFLTAFEPMPLSRL